MKTLLNLPMILLAGCCTLPTPHQIIDAPKGCYFARAENPNVNGGREITATTMQGCQSALSNMVSNNPGYNQTVACVYKPECAGGFPYDANGNPIIEGGVVDNKGSDHQ